MRPRHVGIVICTALLLACVVAGVRRCDGASRAPPASASGAPAQPERDTARGEPAADAAPVGIPARSTAMRESVDTLHRYFSVLGKDDKAEADALWSGGRPATGSEADLRDLSDITALRVRNSQPRALDGANPPDAVEVTVVLQVATASAPPRRYEGWYRLRRAVTGDRWEITSAGIDPSRPAR